MHCVLVENKNKHTQNHRRPACMVAQVHGTVRSDINSYGSSHNGQQQQQQQHQQIRCYSQQSTTTKINRCIASYNGQ